MFFVKTCFDTPDNRLTSEKHCNDFSLTCCLEKHWYLHLGGNQTHYQEIEFLPASKIKKINGGFKTNAWIQKPCQPISNFMKTKSQQMMLVEKSIWFLKKIKNPSDDVYKAAIKRHDYALCFIPESKKTKEMLDLAEATKKRLKKQLEDEIKECREYQKQLTTRFE